MRAQDFPFALNPVSSGQTINLSDVGHYELSIMFLKDTYHKTAYMPCRRAGVKSHEAENGIWSIQTPFPSCIWAASFTL